MSQIRIIIVDDHPFFRQGLHNVLSTEPDVDVVGEAGDGEEAIEKTKELKPDVVLMDINLPKMNGFEAMQQIKDLDLDTNVILVTAYDDEEQVYHAIRGGASAYHAKDVDPQQLMETIRHVSAGRYVVGGKALTEARVANWLMEKYQQFGGELLFEEERFLSPLSPREMEILKLVVRGMSNKEIAYDLGISHQTVKNHITAILSKLGVADRTQATVYALRRGWVPLRTQDE
jgi:DNA-binding NarL/FixJ family response regulator